MTTGEAPAAIAVEGTVDRAHWWQVQLLVLRSQTLLLYAVPGGALLVWFGAGDDSPGAVLFGLLLWWFGGWAWLKEARQSADPVGSRFRAVVASDGLTIGCSHGEKTHPWWLVRSVRVVPPGVRIDYVNGYRGLYHRGHFPDAAVAAALPLAGRERSAGDLAVAGARLVVVPEGGSDRMTAAAVRAARMPWRPLAWYACGGLAAVVVLNLVSPSAPSPSSQVFGLVLVVVGGTVVGQWRTERSARRRFEHALPAGSTAGLVLGEHGLQVECARASFTVPLDGSGRVTHGHGVWLVSTAERGVYLPLFDEWVDDEVAQRALRLPRTEAAAAASAPGGVPAPVRAPAAATIVMAVLVVMAAGVSGWLWFEAFSSCALRVNDRARWVAVVLAALLVLVNATLVLPAGYLVRRLPVRGAWAWAFAAQVVVLVAVAWLVWAYVDTPAGQADLRCPENVPAWAPEWLPS